MHKFKLPIMIVFFVTAVSAGWLLQFSLCAEKTILNNSFYNNYLERHKLYELPNNYFSYRLKNENNNLPETVKKSLNAAISNTVTPELTKDISSHLVNDLIMYLKGHSARAVLSVDLQDINNNITKEFIDQLNNLSSEELRILNLNRNNIESYATNTIFSFNIPDRIYISNIAFSNQLVTNILSLFNSYYKYLLPTIILIFIVCIFVFWKLRGIGSTFKWFGYSMLVSGLLLYISTIIFNGLYDDFLIKSFSSSDLTLTLISTNPLLLATIFKNSILNTLNWISIIYSFIGLLILSVGILLKSNVKKQNSLDRSV